MEFSESLNFGNSTFMDLENLAKNAIVDDDPKSSAAVAYSDHLESIAESPSTARFSQPRENEFEGSKTSNNLRSCKFAKVKESLTVKFRKTKSDSNLMTPSDVLSKINSIDPELESYSDFFHSEFSIEEQEEQKQKPLRRKINSSVIRVSHLEEAFKENFDGIEDGTFIKAGDSPKLDAALLSEELQALLCDDKELRQEKAHPATQLIDINIGAESQLVCSHFTRAQNHEDGRQKSVYLTDDYLQIDEASFIGCEYNDERQNTILKDLERSRNEVSEAMLDETLLGSKSIKPTKSTKTNTSSKYKDYHECYEIHRPQEILKINFDSLRSIANWQIPVSILREYERKGIHNMFDWQIECLSNPKVLFDHKNLVYSAPTSAGKTLVSEILLIKTIVERKKKVLLILPFISVVREKMFYLQDLLQASGYRVEGFFGGYTPPGGFDSINVAICTIEKANAIVNKLLEQGKLGDVGAVIVDEVHLISDPSRGYILELLMAKILYMSRKSSLCIQVVAMSATLSNAELLRNWLEAELYVTTFRPVALQEMIKVGNKLYDNTMKQLRELNTDKNFSAIENDGEQVAQLCIETLLEGCSAIVFCPSKDWCEKLTTQLASAIHVLGKSGSEFGLRLRATLKREHIDELKRKLKDIPTGLDGILERTITFGCAFHHAGMTLEERDLIEAAFKSGALKIIVATSTLSSGVNLPARRVLIRTPLFGGKAMSSLTYRQMIGRAGRTGKDTLGESILVCTESNARIGRELITAGYNPITSCLEMESSTHLKRALLEVIASGVASTKDDILCFVNCTLLSIEKLECSSKDKSTECKNKLEPLPVFVKESVDFLIEYEFIRSQTSEEYNEEIFMATRLGHACLASSMPPTDGLILFAELQKSRRCFVLESELHAVYLVTPYSVCSQLQDIDWLLYLDMWEKLKPSMKKVGELVGIKESFLVRAMRGHCKLDYKLMQVHKRFYIALALQELVNETPINQVALKYKCNRGMLQSLQQMASTFAGIVTAFCNSLNWSTLALIVSQFKERLFFGIHRDLIDLMRLPDLNQKRARVLYDAGITNLIELANAESFAVEKILYDSLSFDTIKQYDNENPYETERRNVERNLCLTGKLELSVNEAAKLLVKNARLFVQYEIGVGNIHWSQNESKVVTSELHSDENMNTPTLKNEAEKENSTKKLLEIRNKKNAQVRKTEVAATINYKTEIRKTEMSPKSELDNQNFENTKEKNSYEEENAKNLLISSSPDKLDSKQVFIRAQAVKIETTKTITLHNQLNSQRESKEYPGMEQCEKKKDELTFSVGNRGPASKCAKVLSELQVAPRTQSDTKRTSPSYINVVGNTTKRPLNGKHESQNNQIDNKVRVKSVANIPVPFIDATVKDATLEEKEKGLKDTKFSLIDKQKMIPPKPAAVSKTNLLRNPPSNIAHKQCQESKSSINDADLELFMQTEESFEMNSGMVKALNAADEIFTDHIIEDEIPSSQRIEEIEEQQVNTPQRSRFLRSYRNQRKESSKVKKMPHAPTPTTKITTSSSSIELSDLSTENSLMQNPHQLNASKVSNSSSENLNQYENVEMVDLCSNQALLESVFKKLKAAKRLAISIALKKDEKKPKALIGSNLLSCPNALKSVPDIDVQFPLNEPSNTFLAGVAFSIQENIVYFMNMQDSETYAGITKELKCKYLALLLQSSELTILMHDAKEQLKAFRKAIPSIKEIGAHLEDPKVANWLLQPDKNLSLTKMAAQFAPNCLKLMKLCEGERDYSGIGLNAESVTCAKIRSSVEACVTTHILKGQKESLERIGSGHFIKFFKELEMPLQLYLCNMESYGFPASESALRQLFQKMIETMKKVEVKIYELHGTRFNLDSTSAVARVLGLHRKSNGRVCTSRQILEKIDSPISQLIISYRKLSVTLKKNIQPLLKNVINNRIHGQSITLTSTGRISMIEPNLQNVAKDFIIELGATDKITISCRSAFFASDEKRCLISSDFCQLEMRILAHLSQDATLLQAINSKGDVFTALAARWNKINENEVSELLRNGTKQICYGIIYGMGLRSLAEALKCTEEEANNVLVQFHAAYPGIRVYTDKVIKFARHKGYIETITGRRRYLEHINSSEPQFRRQAERQAINSTIQGSAADIAKSAITRMENNIVKYRKKLGIEMTRSVQLVLHVHDELIYEVPEEKAKKVAKILRVTMENCVKLNVPLKVKIKIGKSWGSLKEISL